MASFSSQLLWEFVTPPPLSAVKPFQILIKTDPPYRSRSRLEVNEKYFLQSDSFLEDGQGVVSLKPRPESSFNQFPERIVIGLYSLPSGSLLSQLGVSWGFGMIFHYYLFLHSISLFFFSFSLSFSKQIEFSQRTRGY